MSRLKETAQRGNAYPQPWDCPNGATHTSLGCNPGTLIREKRCVLKERRIGVAGSRGRSDGDGHPSSSRLSFSQMKEICEQTQPELLAFFRVKLDGGAARPADGASE
jgi:hypothetical protein